MPELSRRAFIKLSTGALSAIPLLRFPRAACAAAYGAELAPAPHPFGRAIQGGLVVREAASAKAAAVRRLIGNEVVALAGQVEGDGPTAYNKTWYQLADGFVHSAFVQPCENNVNTPLSVVGKEGVWGEVSVPLTEARVQPDGKAGMRYRFYYSCMVQVIAVSTDSDDVPWYQVDDGMTKGLYVRADHVRPIAPEETTPISPDVPPESKRIEVDLAQQIATAYEDDRPVFTARVATGYAGHGTTRGEHRVYLKTPSRRMIGGASGTSDAYDLPGIGWVSYFTASRIAFHSTYWHNDYGHPRSHGCVNMRPEDARWVFRWTTPPTAYEERWTRIGKSVEGTLVKVF